MLPNTLEPECGKSFLFGQAWNYEKCVHVNLFHFTSRFTLKMSLAHALKHDYLYYQHGWFAHLESKMKWRNRADLMTNK